MDLGLFRRRKTVFWLWIICPVLLVAAIHFSIYFYCQKTAEMVQRRQALALFLPQLESGLDLSKAEISRFSVISGTASEAQAALNTRISDISSRCGLVVNSLSITSESTDEPIQKLEASIEGDGGLLSIMKFMNELQSPESLISLVDASLRISQFEPVPVYHWKFEFKTGFVAVSVGDKP